MKRKRNYVPAGVRAHAAFCVSALASVLAMAIRSSAARSNRSESGRIAPARAAQKRSL
jgi:hypothetical protein